MPEPWRLDKLAAVSRIPEHRVVRYAEMGLLLRRPDGHFEADSLHRIRLIQFARNRGIGDYQLAAATASQGDLLGIFEDLPPADDEPYSLTEVADEVGIDEDLRQELREFLNWDDVGNEQDVAALRVLARALTLGLPRDALLQLIRVFADAMDRLAEAETRIFHDYVHERFRAQGMSGRELLQATQSVGKPMLELVEPAVQYFHHRAWRQANREDLLRHLAEEGTAPSATVGETNATVMFIDLVSFTPLTVAMGDLAAADVLRRFGALVRGTAGEQGGRVIKQIGDAFMLVFPAPTDAITFGLAIEELAEAEPQFPALHIGAHHGPVLYREGDYVGGGVNLAARVTSASAAGEFLVTEELRETTKEHVDADFVPLSPRRLKGLPDPIRLVRVRRRSIQRVERKTDPVCGMLLQPGDVHARTTWRGNNFAFCSAECERIFADNPARYGGHDGTR